MADVTQNEVSPNETPKTETPKPEPKKKAKVMKAKVEEKPEVKARYAPKGTISDPAKQKVKILVKDNPKRPGTKCYTWFSWYRNGMTVKEYYEKGGRADHIRWDVQHGFISLS